MKISTTRYNFYKSILDIKSPSRILGTLFLEIIIKLTGIAKIYMDKKKCGICKKMYTGWGNHSEPVKRGQCCDTCNVNIVIPLRMGIFMKKKVGENYN